MAFKEKIGAHQGGDMQRKSVKIINTFVNYSTAAIVCPIPFYSNKLLILREKNCHTVNAFFAFIYL